MADKPTVQNRNYGVDLMKMLSMQMIVFLHVLGAAGILANLPEFSIRYELMWLVEIGSYCAVNCFALATGYLMIGSSAKLHKLIALWLQVVFYTAGITLVFAVLRPDTVDALRWKLSFRPVTSAQYWYFTAYFGLYLLIPFLNKMLLALEKKQLQKLLVCSAVLVFLTMWAQNDIFHLRSGYSMLWLVLLYFAGAYFKLYPRQRPFGTALCLAGYLLMVLLTWASKLLLQLRSLHLYGIAAPGNQLVSYISPTILLASVFLFLGLTGLQFRSKAAIRMVTTMAPASFSVYLIHCHPLVWHHVLTDRLVPLAQLSSPLLLLAVLAIGLAIYLSCSLVDLVRIQIFRLLRIDALSRRIAGFLTKLGRALSALFDKIL